MITKEFNYSLIQTERLDLKVLTLEEAEFVHKHFADENITRYMDIEPCKSIEEAKEIIQFHVDDLGCRWGIYKKATGEFIGTAGFHYLRFTQGNVTAEIGFDLAKAYWGKGYMREVMEHLMEYGFNEMKLTTIDATVEIENLRSIELMKRLGFTKNPELQDGLIYFYLTKEKWLQI